MFTRDQPSRLAGGAAEHGGRMRILIIALSALAAVGVAGCADAAKDEIDSAQQRYELVKKHGSKQEICSAAREVERAYLDANDEDGYGLKKLTADVDCNAALLDRL